MTDERLMQDPWPRRPPRRRRVDEAVPVATPETTAAPPAEAGDPDVLPDPE